MQVWWKGLQLPFVFISLKFLKLLAPSQWSALHMISSHQDSDYKTKWKSLSDEHTAGYSCGLESKIIKSSSSYCLRLIKPDWKWNQFQDTDRLRKNPASHLEQKQLWLMCGLWETIHNLCFNVNSKFLPLIIWQSGWVMKSRTCEVTWETQCNDKTRMLVIASSTSGNQTMLGRQSVPESSFTPRRKASSESGGGGGGVTECLAGGDSGGNRWVILEAVRRRGVLDLHCSECGPMHQQETGIFILYRGSPPQHSPGCLWKPSIPTAEYAMKSSLCLPGH